MLGTQPAYAFGKLLALRALVGLSGSEPNSRTTWIHVGYTGKWKGHQNGPFKLDAADFDSCIAAFKAQVNPIGSDYEHASLIPDGNPKPASMWIQDLRHDGRNLFAKVEFTPRAAELVRAGEYRYCSGVFAFDVPDRVSGDEKPWRCVLRSIGLTNDPFIDGQQPIALTRDGARMAGTKIPKSVLIEQLSALEGDDVSEEQIEALAGSIVLAEVAKNPAAEEPPSGETEMSATPPTPPEPPAAPPPPPVANAHEPPPAEQATADAATAVVAKLSEVLGMDAPAILAALEANTDAIASAFKGTGGAATDLTAAALTAQIAALTARVNELGTKRETDTKAEADAEVDKHAAEGRWLPSATADFRALRHAHPAQYAKVVAGLPKGAAIPLGRDASLAKPDPTPVTDPSNLLDHTKPEVIALDSRLRLLGADDKTRERLIRKQFGR